MDLPFGINMKNHYSRKFLALTVITVLCSLKLAKTLQVANFRTDFSGIDGEIQAKNPNLASRELSVCVRLMPRFPRSYAIIKAEQWALELYSNLGFVNFANPPRNSSSGASYSRAFQYCQPRLPGLVPTNFFSVGFLQSKMSVEKCGFFKRNNQGLH